MSIARSLARSIAQPLARSLAGGEGAGGGVPQTPDWAALFGNSEIGGVWIPALSDMYTDSTATTPAVDGNNIGRIDDLSGNNPHAIQATSGSRPVLTGDRLVISSGQSLRATFSSSIVHDVVRAMPGYGAQYQRGRLASNRHDINYDTCGTLVINRTLTTEELAVILPYFDHLAKLGNTVGLYADLLSSSRPLAAFVESWTTTGLSGTIAAAPAGAGVPTGDTNNDLILEYTVSGSAGDTVLSVSSGDHTLFSNAYGGVIQHDDGTWSFYSVMNVTASEMTISPPLKSAVTAKVMRNNGSEVNGQHLTRPANRALAWNVFRTTNKTGYRGKWVSKWSPVTDIRNDFSLVNITSAHTLFSVTNAFVGTGTYAGKWLSRNRLSIRPTDATAPFTGSGITRTVALGGSSGFMELFISAFPVDAAEVKYTVTLEVDSVVLHNQEYIGIENGYQRILVDYEDATSATVTITRTDAINASYEIRVDDLTFWSYDRSIAWNDRVIDINGKTVVIGDSWTRWSDDAFSDELAALKTAAGGTGSVVNVGLGGQTAEWGLANFDSLVAPENPDDVVILFFTNDKNQFGGSNASRWMCALFEIARKCQAIGARPIIVMPVATQSLAQSADHGVFAGEIGLGLQV